MKTKLLCLFTCISFLAFKNANAKIWRVNNNGYSADFTNIQTANNNNNVSDGDTIHVEGSAIPYGGTNTFGISISKKLIIIGPGYFLTENPNTTNTKLPAESNGFGFNAGSAGSELIGVYVSGGISINVSDVTIKRCRIANNISLNNNLSDVKIIQNFFSGSGTTSLIQIPGSGFPTDVIFDNNICQQTLRLNPTYTFQECNNNIFDCPALTGSPSLVFSASAFYNNILTNTNATVGINGGNYTYVDYNISASANNQFGTSGHNIVVSDMTALFVGATGNSTDGAYQLKPSSAGSSNGSDGTDRGVFGGLSPSNHYTLSGLPDIPVIYNISSSGVAAGSLPVTIKAKTVQ